MDGKLEILVNNQKQRSLYLTDVPILCSSIIQQEQLHQQEIQFLFGTEKEIIIYNFNQNTRRKLFQNFGKFIQIKHYKGQTGIVSYISDQFISYPLEEDFIQSDYKQLIYLCKIAIIDLKKEQIICELPPQPNNGQFAINKNDCLIIPYTKPSIFQYSIYKIFNNKSKNNEANNEQKIKYYFKFLESVKFDQEKQKELTDIIYCNDDNNFYINYKDQTCVQIQYNQITRQYQRQQFNFIKLQGYIINQNKLYNQQQLFKANINFNNIKSIASNQKSCFIIYQDDNIDIY